MSKIEEKLESFTKQSRQNFCLQLMPYNIQITKAHLKMLKKIGILNRTELSKISMQIKRLEKDLKSGKIKAKPNDNYPSIEQKYFKRLRKLSKKIETGRSKKDQQLTALRLYILDQVKPVKKELKKVISNLINKAEQYRTCPLPNTKKPTSISHLYIAHAESLLDDIDFLKSTIESLSKMPLGIVDGFGLPLIIDRELTKKELGFKKLQLNSRYAISNFGKFASIYMEALSQIATSLSKLSQEIIEIQEKSPNTITINKKIKSKKALKAISKKALDIIKNQAQVKSISTKIDTNNQTSINKLNQLVIASTNTIISSADVANTYLKAITIKSKKLKKEKIEKQISLGAAGNLH